MEAWAKVENRIVRDTLAKRFGLPVGASERAEKAVVDDLADFDMAAPEFSFVEYRLQATDKDSLAISIAVPSSSADDPTSKTTSSSSSSRKGKRSSPIASQPPAGALESLQAAGLEPPLAHVQDKPEKGFTLTLRLDLTHLPEGLEARARLADSLASLRLLVMGAPLRTLLRQLAQGALVPETQEMAVVVGGSSGGEGGEEAREERVQVPVLTTVAHRPGQAFFAAVRSPDELLVVHPLQFSNSQDMVFVSSFLTALKEAGPPGAASPAFSVTPPGSPPPSEVQHAPAPLLRQNAGYASFVLRREHVRDPQRLERLCWSMCTFHAAVASHVKGTRAFLHSRTRRRVEAMSQSLLQSHEGQAK